MGSASNSYLADSPEWPLPKSAAPAAAAHGTAACVVATADITSQRRWSTVLREQLRSVASLTIVVTPTHDITNIIGGRIAGGHADGGHIAGGHTTDGHSAGGHNAGGHSAGGLASGHTRAHGWRPRRPSGTRVWSARDGALLVVRSGYNETIWRHPSSGPGEPSRWGAAEARMQYECYGQLERAEARRGSPFATVLYARADAVWMPGASPRALVDRASAFLRAVQTGAVSLPPHSFEFGPERPSTMPVPPSEEGPAAPVVLLPDGEDYWGCNDRMAIMNRRAAPSYFGRYSYIATAAKEAKPFGLGAFGNSENVLHHALQMGRVLVRRFPTLAALECCRAARRACYRTECHTVCSNGTRLRLKYEWEALKAATNAHALLTGSSKLKHAGGAACGGDEAVCLVPPPPEPSGPLAESQFHRQTAAPCP